MDELKIFKMSTKQAVENLRGCISAGYKLKEEILTEFTAKRADLGPDDLAGWSAKIDNWINQCYEKLSETYESDVEPLNFLHHRAIGGASIGLPWQLSDTIIRLEGKIAHLNELYYFTLHHSNVVINANGSVIFQTGDNSSAEIRK